MGSGRTTHNASLQAALKEAQSGIPECVAVGHVALANGELLALSGTGELRDVVASAAAELFEGTGAADSLFGAPVGGSEFQEILIFSRELLHAFIRSKKHPDQAVVFVCQGTVNIGMALSKTRLAVATLEASF
ncbi:MAG: hypothetical protein AAGF12_05950 [Myxococcota bacterium]